MYNKDHVIKKTIDFLAQKLKNSSQSNFFCTYNASIVDWLTIRLCEEARKISAAEIYFCNTSNVLPEFEFCKQVSFSEDSFRSSRTDLVASSRSEIVYFSETSKSIIVSSLTINQAKYCRIYHKHNNIADLYPIMDLYYSDCLELAKHLGIQNKILDECIMRDAKFDFNSKEHEYCFKEDDKYYILTDQESPNKRKDWFKYSKQQKELIAKLHQREKLTRHKEIRSRTDLYPVLQGT